jgi:hypothetical protein
VNPKDWDDCFPPGFVYPHQGRLLLGVGVGPAYPKVIDARAELSLPGQGASLAGSPVRGKLQCKVGRLAADFRIVEAVADTPPGGQERWLYDVEVFAPGASGGPAAWVKVCAAAPEMQNRHLVLALAGTWEKDGSYGATPGSVTLACADAMAAKCARVWHYQPGDELHTACTRMARADYCGNGESQTEDGTPVDAWDTEGISRHTEPAKREPTAHFEAAWTPRGALCIDHLRWKDVYAPACALTLPHCTSETAAKALVDAGSRKLVFNDSCTPDPTCGAKK